MKKELLCEYGKTDDGGPVVAEQVVEAMLGRRRRLQTEAAEREAEPAALVWLFRLLRRSSDR